MEKLGAQVSARSPFESDSEDGYDSDEFTPKKKLPRTGHLIFIYCWHYSFKIIDWFIHLFV